MYRSRVDPFPPPNNGAAGDKFTVQEVLDVHELANMTSDFRATTAESGEWFNSVTSDVAPAGFASSDTTEADGPADTFRIAEQKRSVELRRGKSGYGINVQRRVGEEGTIVVSIVPDSVADVSGL
eukprot:gene8131-10045_t